MLNAFASLKCQKNASIVYNDFEWHIPLHLEISTLGVFSNCAVRDKHAQTDI